MSERPKGVTSTALLGTTHHFPKARFVMHPSPVVF